MTTWHFSGVAGAGMNPLARLLRAQGVDVQGSDRSFDRDEQGEARALLERDGIRIVPQDGSGLHAGIVRCIVSAAVEADTPDLRAARAHGVAIVPRPALLAEIVNAAAPGVAISGTAGKSSIVGMLAWITRQLGVPATILGGAALAGEGRAGGFAAGPRHGLTIAEACESDGTLPGYAPSIGLIHNIGRDHGELDEVRHQFERFAAGCTRLLVHGACPEASALADAHPAAVRYGRAVAAARAESGRTETGSRTATGSGSDLPLEVLTVGPHRARGLLGLPDGSTVDIDLPQPGEHQLDNAAAALAVTRALGLDVVAAAAALRSFPGIARRFEVVGTTDTGIRVIDDYAHNGAKIAAAVRAAQAGCTRLIAIFQPHGFGPARFLRAELRDLLPGLLRPADRFCYAPVYYAGGSVAKDISSADLARDLAADGRVSAAADADALLSWCAETAQSGDSVLLMGARDPRLPELARALHGLL